MTSALATDPTLDRVRALAAPVCEQAGVDLVDVVWTTEGGARTLRVTIERVAKDGSGPSPDSAVGWGVTLDDCADVSRQLSDVLDSNDAVPGRYNLEVSSPGIERPLATLEDFRRFTGFLAKAKLRRPAPDGQRVLRGRLEAATDAATVTMRVDGKAITVPIADVVTAHLVYEMPAEKSPSEKQRAPRGAGAKSPKAKGTPRTEAPEKKTRRGAES
jgi:ribosome maturation factor RimP